MEQVTAVEVKKAAEVAGITQVLHHQCGCCDGWTRYLIIKGDLFYDAKCGCSTPGSLPIQQHWSQAADWINMQSDDANRIDIMKRFGMGTNSNGR